MCTIDAMGYAGSEMHASRSRITRAALMIAIALPLVGIVACTRPSGSQDPSPDSDREAPTASKTEPAGKTEANESASVDASKTDSHDPDCVRACDRITECVGAKHGDDCLTDCQQELRVRNPKAPASLADCFAKLTCESIEESLSQDAGSTGNCYMASLNAE